MAIMGLFFGVLYDNRQGIYNSKKHVFILKDWGKFHGEKMDCSIGQSKA